ncbi:MAG: hypothetical protein ACW9W3_05570 [Candidatus Nitrosopumilus sp. bin_68KS]
MKLVWVVIPLILIGIIGMQESFAEDNLLSYKEGFSIGNVTVVDPSKITYPQPFKVGCPLFTLDKGPFFEMRKIKAYFYTDLIVIGKVTSSPQNISSEYGNYSSYNFQIKKFLKNNNNVKSSIQLALNCEQYDLDTKVSQFENDSEMLLVLYKKSEIQEFMIEPLPYYEPIFFTYDLKPSHQNYLMNRGSWDYSMSNTILCLDDLVPIQKKSNDSFACVKPQTAEKLIERGWARS